MNNEKCECKDSKIYYVLAGGGLVLLTYFIKNRQQTYSQLSQKQSLDEKITNEKLYEIIQEYQKQLDYLTNTKSSSLISSSSKINTPRAGSVESLRDNKSYAIRRLKFNMI